MQQANCARTRLQKESSLYKVMACLLDVKKRSAKTEASFGPLQDTVRSMHDYSCHEPAGGSHGWGEHIVQLLLK